MDIDFLVVEGNIGAGKTTLAKKSQIVSVE